MSLNKKRGQIAIFVVIALVVVFAILMFFFLRRGIKIDVEAEFNPQSFVRSCSRDAVQQALEIVMTQGGSVEPSNYKLYDGNKVEYLCYTNRYYEPCINQQPLYIKHVEDEISSFIKPKIDECFFALEQELTRRKYSFEQKGQELAVILEEGSIIVDIDREVSYGKESIDKVSDFRYQFTSHIYELAKIAREIGNQEALFCNFNTASYSTTYPDFDIEKKNIGFREDASSIYVIRDKRTQEVLLIAIRSCEIPPGLMG